MVKTHRIWGKWDWKELVPRLVIPATWEAETESQGLSRQWSELKGSLSNMQDCLKMKTKKRPGDLA